MGKVRVFQRADGSVMVNHPNPRQRLPGESDAAMEARVFAHKLAIDPEVQSLPFVDIDKQELPARDLQCPTCGEMHSVRDNWRMRGKNVEVDASLPNPRADLAHKRQELDNELDKLSPDAVRIALIERDIRRMEDGLRAK